MENSKKDTKFAWPLVGNSHIIDFLSKSINNNKISHSYIFSGPDGLGKTTLAIYFSKILLCGGKTKKKPCQKCDSCQQFKKEKASMHGDFYLLEKEKDKKNISIEQVRDFIRKLGMSSFLNSYKIGIIKDAESLSLEAANALLKTLEEPKEKVVIILVASNLENMPATILSRSQVFYFRPVKKDLIYDYLIHEHKASRSQAKNLSRLCVFRPALALKFLENKDFYEAYTQKGEIFLDFLNQDINSRWLALTKITEQKFSGQEFSKEAEAILNIWQGLARDLLLSFFGHNDLVQHEIFKKKILELKDKFGPEFFLETITNLEKAKNYLRANVNPKLVLENVAARIT